MLVSQIHRQVLACLAMLSLAFVQCPAEAVQKAVPKKPLQAGAKKQSLYVPAAQAKAEIMAHIKTIKDAEAEMYNKYDYYNAKDTLLKAFAAGGVNSDGMQYAQSWGENGLYLTWTWPRDGYYVKHREILQASLNHINRNPKAGVLKSDLAYLSNGMRQWSTKEERYDRWFQQEVQHETASAGFWGQVIARRRNRPTTDYEYKLWEAESARIQEQAWAAGSKAKVVDKKIREASKEPPLFSALGSKERIAIKEEPPCEMIKVKNNQVPRLEFVPLLEGVKR